jgi:hypothetical protein
MPCSDGRENEAQQRRDEKIRKRWQAGLEGTPDLPWEIVVPHMKTGKIQQYRTIAAFAMEIEAREVLPAIRKFRANAQIMRCPC